MFLGAPLGSSGLPGIMETGTGDGLCRTEIELSQAWSCTLQLRNQGDGVSCIFYPSGPPVGVVPTSPHTTSVGVSGLGCSATLAYSGSYYRGPAVGPPVGPDPDVPPADFWHWGAYYWLYTLTVSAPGVGNSVTHRFGLWLGDGWSYGVLGTGAPDLTLLDSVDLDIDVVVSLTNVYRKEQVAQNSIPTNEDRNLMDFTDLTRDGSWYADADSQATITAGGLTRTGALSGAGGEITIGDTWALTASWAQARYPSTGTTYGIIADLKFNDIAVDTTGLDLYYSTSEQGATRAPDQSSANLRHWSRYSADADSYITRCLDSGGITSRCDGAVLSSSRSWSGTIYPPTTAVFKLVDGKHTDATAYSGIQFTSVVQEWALVGGTWTATPKVLTDGDSATQQYRSWLFAHEWQVFSAVTNCTADLWDDWRVANGEDVGGANARLNDERMGMLCHPRSASDRTTTDPPWWGPLVVVTHLGSVDLNDPPGETRPTLWEGGDGVTVDGDDDDIWTVAATTVAPVVTRDPATRRVLRETALQAAMADPEFFNPIWMYLTKANYPDDTGENPAWVTAVPVEDVTDLEAFKYLRVGLVAPRAGTVTLVCHYTTPANSDTATTCREHREIEITRTAHTLTLSFDVGVGANSVLLDYGVPAEGACPVRELRPNLVTQWEWQLPDAGATDEQWELTTFEAVADPGETGRSEPAVHGQYRYKRSWDWMSGNWVGFLGHHDGALVLEMDDGTSHQDSEQFGMQYIREVNHCPLSSATGTLHFAKPLTSLQAEIGMREGFDLVQYAKPEETSYNKDDLGGKLKGGFHWWDVRNAHHHDDGGSLQGCVVAGYWDLVAGIEQDVWLYAVPQGMLTGLVTNATKTARMRSTGTVVGQRSADSGATWETVGSDTPDEHGRFEIGPVLEKGFLYRLGTNPTTTAATNREYSWLQALINAPASDPFCCADAQGISWVVYLGDGGDVLCRYLEPVEAPTWGNGGTPFDGPGWERPSIAVCADGSLLVAATDTSTGSMSFARSRDRGRTWEAVSTATIGNGLERGAIFHRNGQTWCVGWDADEIIMQGSSSDDLTAEVLSSDANTDLTVCAAVVGEGDTVPRSAITETADGRGLLVVVDAGGTLTAYRARDLRTAAGFAIVA